MKPTCFPSHLSLRRELVPYRIREGVKQAGYYFSPVAGVFAAGVSHSGGPGAADNPDKEPEMVLKGKCPECGAIYYGWALRFPRNQMCENCGVGLEISDSAGGDPFTGYSPFTAEEYKIRLSHDLPSPESRTARE